MRRKRKQRCPGIAQGGPEAEGRSPTICLIEGPRGEEHLQDATFQL